MLIGWDLHALQMGRPMARGQTQAAKAPPTPHFHKVHLEKKLVTKAQLDDGGIY